MGRRACQSPHAGALLRSGWGAATIPADSQQAICPGGVSCCQTERACRRGREEGRQRHINKDALPQCLAQHEAQHGQQGMALGKLASLGLRVRLHTQPNMSEPYDALGSRQGGTS